MTELFAHLMNPPEKNHLDYLCGKLDADIRLTIGDEIPKNIHVLISGRPTKEQLQDRPHLHSLIIPFAGLPQETVELMRGYQKIGIYNLHHNASMTGEMAVALLLAAAKRIPPIDRTFRHHDWTPRYEVRQEVMLEGKTALILGYGSVGRHVGRVCWAMGMHILGIRRQVGTGASTLVELAPPHKLHEWLPRAHVLIVCVPGTPETRGMIGEKELAMLPQGAIVVNVGRGDVVNPKALYDALKSKHLHSAGIDVWYNYPLNEDAHINTPPADYPFHELDNIVMSPHRGGGGGNPEIEQRRMDALAESLNAAARGRPVPHQVSLKAGY